MVAKLTDVAELAGVSPTTVSRVINQKGYLSQKTIQKVQAAIDQLGYKPNNLARSLQGKSAKLIGLIFPNIGHLFYAELIGHLEQVLFDQGYKTILCNSDANSAKEREYLEMLEANQVDGIISGSHNLDICDYNRVTAPIIAFDRNLSPDIPVVSSDNLAGGMLAARTLSKLNCRHIMMITGNDNSNSPTVLRRTGFHAVLPDAPVFNLSSDYSPLRKEMEIKHLLLTHRPDGIFTSDDLTAMLVLKIAAELDLKVPQDLKLIGYDGTHFMTSYYPQLTTIQQPMREMAALMVDLLLKKIQGQKVPADTYALPIRLHAGQTA